MALILGATTALAQAPVSHLITTISNPADSGKRSFWSAHKFHVHYARNHFWVVARINDTAIPATDTRLYSSWDGYNWTVAATDIFSFFPPDLPNGWAARFSGDTFIAFGFNSGDSNWYYRKGILKADGTASFGSEISVVGGNVDQGANALIINSQPALWIAGDSGNDTDAGSLIFGSELDSPTWTAAPSVPALSPSTGGGFAGGAIFPVAGDNPGDLIVIRATTLCDSTTYQDCSTNTHTVDDGNHNLVSIRYDADLNQWDSNWTNVAGGTAATNFMPGIPDDQAQERFSAVRDTKERINVVYISEANRIVHYRKERGYDGSWTQVSTDVAARDVARLGISAGAGSSLYLFYEGATGGTPYPVANSTLYYRYYDGGGWGSETQLIVTNLNDSLGLMEMAYECTIGFGYNRSASPPYYLRFMVPNGADCFTFNTSVGGTQVQVGTYQWTAVWDSAAGSGGGLSEFYGRIQNNGTTTRVGDTNKYNLFATWVDVNGGEVHYEGYDSVSGGKGGSVVILEATSARTKLRQNYTYVSGGNPITLERDWSVYTYPKLAIDETLTFNGGPNAKGAHGIFGQGVISPCGSGNPFFCAGNVDSGNAGLWVDEDSTTYSDLTAFPYSEPFFGGSLRGGSTPTWEHVYAAGDTPPSRYSQVRETTYIATPTGSFTTYYLFHPHQSGLTAAGTQWQRYAADYRSPDDLGSPALPTKGSGWFDAAENTYSISTPADYFNEAENAYLLDFDPSQGLEFTLDGGTCTALSTCDLTTEARTPTRRKPFFKIRQWRSVQKPETIVFNVSERLGQDYKADAKPFSRASFCSGGCTELSPNGGLLDDSSEYLNDPVSTQNYELNFIAGNYLYLGSDSKFRGINVILATPGVGDAYLQWEFWDGSWADLRMVTGFTDETNNLTGNGTIYWGDDATETDPSGWTTTSVNGSPQLYFVRASLSSGSYGTLPRESRMVTDILLLQYCGDFNRWGNTISLTVPTPTAVELASFEARGVDGAVELSWETGSEIDNLGFHIYRATEEGGPYTRVTGSPIPGLGSSPAGARYSYLDTGLTNGVTCFYKLEDIETTGRTEMHGPVSATPEAGVEGGGAPPSEEGSGTRITVGEPDVHELRLLEQSLGGVVLELRTGGFYAYPQEDGTVRLEVPGYDWTEEIGQPLLPIRRSWVEAVVGRGVEILSVERLDEELFDGLRPTIAGAPEVDVSRRGVVRASRSRGPRAFGDGEGWYPAESARMVSVGFQQDIKKALVELCPLRWDGGLGRLVLTHRLVVRAVFRGRDPNERTRDGVRGTAYYPRGSHASRRVLARLVTREAGLYGVGFDEVFGSGARSRLSTGWLRLSRQGETVAFHVEPDPALYERGSRLYFVSEGAEANPYGNEAVYELELSGDGAVMPVGSASPSGEGVSFYWRKVEREENRVYQATLVEAEGPWLWSIVLASDGKPVRESYAFDVTRLASEVFEPSRLRVWLQGGSDFESDPDHHVRVYVNGRVVGEASWNGMTPWHVDAEIPTGLLRPSSRRVTNTVEIENVGDTEASISSVILDRFEVEYPSRTEAGGGRLEGRFSESGTVEVEGVGGPGLVVWQKQTGPVWLEGMEETETGLRFRAEAEGSYLVVGADGVLRAEVRRPLRTNLKMKRMGAEYLMVGPREFVDAAGELLEYRRSQGLRALGVSVEQVVSEFGYGEGTPEAIRDFLSYAYHQWTVRPRYVVLLGDGTFDYKNYLGAPAVNWLPPWMMKTSALWTASDAAYAAVNGEDLLPDLAIGRLPGATAEEIRKMVEKVLAYEASGVSLGERVVMVSDNPDEAGDFDGNAEELTRGVLSGVNVKGIRLSELGKEGTRSAIQAAFNEGSSLMSYIGHGAIHFWADENVLNIWDVESFGEQPKQPLLLTMTCLNGYFQFPYFNALAEEVLKAEGKGVVAAFSPSGVSWNDSAHVFHRLLLEELLRGGHERLGDAILEAQSAYAEEGALPEMLAIYHLLGDPAMRIH